MPPPFLGSREIAPTIGELRDSIDWTFFFHAWELKGRFPAILDDPRQGPVARDLYAAATALLDGIEADELLRARGVYGFWSAAAEQDDIALAGGERFPMLRQQADYGDSRPNRSLADFVAPADTGLADHVGAFAVAIHGAEALARDYEDRHDDYSAIIVKALADRLAEAFAEWLHGQVRTSWYAPDEELARDDIVAERYRGIRPAFGYPACPDHSEKRTLFGLLDAGRAGLELTESCAMTPAAAVSGLYFAHPAARYFAIGRIGQDQLHDYATRKQMTLEEAERWLRPNL